MKKKIITLRKIKLFTIFIITPLIGIQASAYNELNNDLTYKEFDNEALFQTITITGNVTDKSGMPLPGVSVLIKGTSRGVLTDFDGNYKIDAEKGEVIVFSYIGMKTTSITVGNSTNIEVSLEEDASKLDEVVVIGYGSQKKSDLTGSISSLSGEGLDKFVTGNASQALQGRMSGVRIESNGGGPGATTNIVIRGVSSFTNSSPLFVIDGMFSDNMDFINPSDIKSIEVLKDASAGAIYGSRAANGVVIITTNSGKGSEGIKIDIETSIGTQSVIKKLDWISGAEYATLRNTLADANNSDRLPGFNELLDPSVNTIIDDIAISSAPLINTSASIYGTQGDVSFNVSANWLDQEGIVVASNFDRKTFRANLAIDKGKLKITESFAMTRVFERPNTIWNLPSNILPSVPFLNPENDGGYGGATLDEHGFDGNNHIARSLLWDRHNQRDNLIGSLALEYELAKGLKVKLNTGITHSKNLSYTFLPTFFFSDQIDANQASPELREFTDEATRTLVEGTINYDKKINNHNFNALFGITRQNTEVQSRGSITSGFPSNDIRQIGAASTIARLTGSEVVSTLSSLFGRLNYNYDSKYFLSATFRRDGSSRFSEDKRFGLFPSVAVGWTISKENFLKDSDLISNIKLRASYGELGSQDIADYAYIPVLNINSDAVFGGGQTRVPGVSQTVFANPNLVWETTKSTNIGLDLGFLNNQLTFTMDYFDKKSEDILVSLQIPPTSGTTVPVAQNAASIQNSGFEFAGTYKGVSGDFTFNVTPNITFLHNEVLALGENIAPITGGAFLGNITTRTAVGDEVASFYGYQVVGIYQSQDEIDSDGAMADANAQPGDFRYEDISGPEGVPDGVLTADDQKVLGSYIPDFEYGLAMDFSYKNFDMNLIFNGVSGVDVWNFGKRKNLLDLSSNMTREALNYWRPDNTNTNVPRVGGGANNTRESSFQVESGDYFRLRNVQIGYSLPEGLLNKLNIRKIRIYGSVQNLFTITNYSGYYPEIGRGQADEDRVVDNNNTLFYSGVDQSTYPTARTFILGVQLGF
jgi:TonB-linked SusC/RagA family outer membrane protein